MCLRLALGCLRLAERAGTDVCKRVALRAGEELQGHEMMRHLGPVLVSSRVLENTYEWNGYL
jgi:hypothetical protein